jgi:hypothetical protein
LFARALLLLVMLATSAAFSTAATSSRTLNRLVQWRRDFPAATTAVLLDESSDVLELGFREAGAQLVISSLFDLILLARVAERHLAQVEAPEADWREAIMARMPFPAVARSP